MHDLHHISALYKVQTARRIVLLANKKVSREATRGGIPWGALWVSLMWSSERLINRLLMLNIVCSRGTLWLWWMFMFVGFGWQQDQWENLRLTRVISFLEDPMIPHSSSHSVSHVRKLVRVNCTLNTTTFRTHYFHWTWLKRLQAIQFDPCHSAHLEPLALRKVSLQKNVWSCLNVVWGICLFATFCKVSKIDMSQF